MKTIEVPRGVVALSFFCTVICVAAGCIAILSWIVTGQPHPDWVTIRQPHPPVVAPPIVHRTAPNPIPPTNDDLIPPTNLPER